MCLQLFSDPTERNSAVLRLAELGNALALALLLSAAGAAGAVSAALAVAPIAGVSPPTAVAVAPLRQLTASEGDYDPPVGLSTNPFLPPGSPPDTVSTLVSSHFSNCMLVSWYP